MTIKKINLALTAILVLVVSYAAADLFWLIMQPKAIHIADKPVIKRQASLTVPNTIFGYPRNIVKTPKKVKQSRLNLDLVGVLFKHKNPLAIIARSGKASSAKIYKVNDSIKSGVIVNEIGGDFVFLKRNGKLEKLTFRRSKNKNDIIINNKKSKTQSSKLSTLQKNEVNDYRLEIVNNPKKLLSIVSAVPFFKDGKMQGIKVKPNQNQQLFKDLGFKSGDIIIKINQINIDNFNKFAKIRNMIYSSSAFNLTIKRNKKTFYLNIQL